MVGRAAIAEKCIECKLCQKECGFLRKYGKPKAIAERYNAADAAQEAMAFECSLCELCAAVCPVKINPAVMFLEMRQEAVRSGGGNYPQHSAIVNYEKRGTSRRYTYYALPQDSDTIFFPGCTLAGTRPDKVIRLYQHLSKTIPGLGIVLDCCTKPSKDLGRQDHFQTMFNEMKSYLLESGVRQVLVACASCHRVFKDYGGKLGVRSVYEILEEEGLPEAGEVSGTVTIHDPCAVRLEEDVQVAVRSLVEGRGLSIEEMPHHREKTLCCGEGGSAAFFSPGLAKNWGSIRKDEAQNNQVITYCAGCASALRGSAMAHHVLDLLFEPQATLSGKVRVSRSPWTYWNRIRLKNHFKKTIPAVVTRERTINPEAGPRERSKMLRRLLRRCLSAIGCGQFH